MEKAVVLSFASEKEKDLHEKIISILTESPDELLDSIIGTLFFQLGSPVPLPEETAISYQNLWYVLKFSRELKKIKNT